MYIKKNTDCTKKKKNQVRVFVLIFQITFQVKRMRKPKTEVSESWAGEEEVFQSESAAHSVLELSGPTVPSPGPSGTYHFNKPAAFISRAVFSLVHRTFLGTGVRILQEGKRTTAVWAGQGLRSVSAHGG